MLKVLVYFFGALSAIVIVLTAATAAVAQQSDRPADKRVVCTDGFALINVYADVAGDIIDRLESGTEITIIDFVFGPQATAYFFVGYARENLELEQTGFVSANDVKNVCDS